MKEDAGFLSYRIKDSGKRQEFAGGMVRDTTEGKPSFLNVLFGPMLDRWAWHTTKGREKYPDVDIGVPNWTLAEGREELLRAEDSAMRHMLQWLRGERDEDHAAAVYFNINLAEYIRDKLVTETPGGIVEYDPRNPPMPGLTNGDYASSSPLGDWEAEHLAMRAGGCR